MSRQYQTRTFSQQSAIGKKQSRFAPPPIIQPKAAKKSKAELPEWKPGGSGIDPLAGLQQTLQAKLTVGQPNDKYEKEADRVASEVVQRLRSAEQTSASEDASGESSVRRSPDNSQAPISIQPSIQLKGAIANKAISAELESSLNRAKSGGQALDANLQRSMGSAMGADFSGVNIHTDSQSDRLNRALQAKAFTTGNHIFFKSGEYNPSSQGGQGLIAHELTHVMQQKGTSVTSGVGEIVQRQVFEVPVHADTDNITRKFGTHDKYYQQEDDNCTYTMLSMDTNDYPYINPAAIPKYSEIIKSNRGKGDVSPHYRNGTGSTVYNANSRCAASIGLHKGGTLLTVYAANVYANSTVTSLISTKKTIDEHAPQHIGSHQGLNLGNSHVHFYHSNPNFVEEMLAWTISSLEKKPECIGGNDTSDRNRNIVANEIREHFDIPPVYKSPTEAWRQGGQNDIYTTSGSKQDWSGQSDVY